MKNLRWLFLILTVFGLALAIGVGCGSKSSSSSSTADDDLVDDDESPADDDESPADDDTAATAWIWQPVTGAICRDGSGTGYAVRAQAGAKNLVIFLQGGGACYSPSSCQDNPSHFGEADFEAWKTDTGVKGILNEANPANPVKDWNIAYVPYCTGDLYTGSKTDGAAPGVTGTQQFVGHVNLQKIIAAVKAQFPEPERILLGGESAGGFGATLNYADVARAWSGVPVALLDDSGPLFNDTAVLSQCLQLGVTVLWNVSPLSKEQCANCVPFGGWYSGWYKWLAQNFANGTFGLFSSMNDETIRSFFGVGQDLCSGTTDIPADTYAQGLRDLRTLTAPLGRWTTYYIPGDTHTITKDDDMFFNTTVGGVAFTTWLGELLTSVPSSVGP